MARIKMKQSEIKNFVKTGAAKDVTTGDITKIKESVTCIGYSTGVYGINGGLFKGDKSKKLYAITSRSTNLFRWL